MKFGGTSVGKPQRMHEVANLITRDDERKIVVLSALSGTTNALIEISESLASGDRSAAKQQIEALHAHYQNFVLELLAEEETRKKANEVLNEHFEFLTIILKISFSQALNKDILAQGELLSTKLFSLYLEEKKVEVISAELTWVPATTIELNEDHSNEVLKLVDHLEQDEDVQKVYHNLK